MDLWRGDDDGGGAAKLVIYSRSTEVLLTKSQSECCRPCFYLLAVARPAPPLTQQAHHVRLLAPIFCMTVSSIYSDLNCDQHSLIPTVFPKRHDVSRAQAIKSVADTWSTMGWTVPHEVRFTETSPYPIHRLPMARHWAAQHQLLIVAYQSISSNLRIAQLLSPSTWLPRDDHLP